MTERPIDRLVARARRGPVRRNRSLGLDVTVEPAAPSAATPEAPAQLDLAGDAAAPPPPPATLAPAAGFPLTSTVVEHPPPAPPRPRDAPDAAEPSPLDPSPPADEPAAPGVAHVRPSAPAAGPSRLLARRDAGPPASAARAPQPPGTIALAQGRPTSEAEAREGSAGAALAHVAPAPRSAPPRGEPSPSAGRAPVAADVLARPATAARPSVTARSESAAPATPAATGEAPVFIEQIHVVAAAPPRATADPFASLAARRVGASRHRAVR